jgi:hypothetical protein
MIALLDPQIIIGDHHVKAVPAKSFLPLIPRASNRRLLLSLIIQRLIFSCKLFISQKHDHMIALLDPQIIIGDHHVIPAHDGANEYCRRLLPAPRRCGSDRSSGTRR